MRRTVVINAGNLLELAGAVLACWGVERLAGVSWMLVLAAVLFVAAAELVYDSHVWRFRLPSVRPRQRVSMWLLGCRRRLQRWRWLARRWIGLARGRGSAALAAVRSLKA